MRARSFAASGLVLVPLGCASTVATSESAGARASAVTTTTTHTPREPEQTAASLESCNGGSAQACHAAALDAYYATPSPETDARALGLFEKACAAGYAPSCNGLGVLYKTGRGVEKDATIAAQLFRRSCEADASTGCQHLADALRHGRGAPKSLSGADRAEARGKCLFESSLAKDGRVCPTLE